MLRRGNCELRDALRHPQGRPRGDQACPQTGRAFRLQRLSLGPRQQTYNRDDERANTHRISGHGSRSIATGAHRSTDGCGVYETSGFQLTVTRQRRIVFGLSGPIAAGKSTASDYLMDEFGAKVLRNSEVLERILRSVSAGTGRVELIAIGRALFDEFGTDILSIGHCRKIGGDIGESTPYVIDGIRYPSEVSHYAARFDFMFLYVDAGFNTRYQRWLSGDGKDSPDPKRTFAEIEASPQEAHGAELRGLADHVILNEGPYSELFLRLSEVVPGRR